MLKVTVKFGMIIWIFLKSAFTKDSMTSLNKNGFMISINHQEVSNLDGVQKNIEICNLLCNISFKDEYYHKILCYNTDVPELRTVYMPLLL